MGVDAEQVPQEGGGVQMSELNVETIVPQGTTITLQMYPKSEADKVIAELEESHKMEVEQSPCRLLT